MLDLAYSEIWTQLIYVVMALGVFILFTGVNQLLRGSENRNESKSRRLKMINEGASTGELLALLKPEKKGGILTHIPFVGDLPSLITQAGYVIQPERLVFLCVLTTVVLLAIGINVTDPLKAAGIALGVGMVLPIMVLKSKRTKRMTSLIHQLPDSLDLLARGLKVGHPLNTSIGAVGNEMSDPIGTEFGLIFDQVSYGDDLVDAFQEFADRVDLEDVHYLSASIGIQHGTGGDLARVIEVLAKVIRTRIAMRRKIQAISSEGRLTAWLLSALPLVIFGFTSYLTPSYYGSVSTDPMYMPMAAAVVFFTVLNFFVMRKLVNFHI